MTEFPLKIIAMATMLCDHIAYFMMAQGFIGEPAYTIMRSTGRCAFLIYAFLMVEAFRHLRDKPERLKSHYIKLGLILLASEIPYDYFRKGIYLDPMGQNVMFTLLIGFTMLAVLDKIRGRYCLQFLVAASAAAISTLINADYQFAGVLLMLGFYWYLEHYLTRPISRRILMLLAVMVAYILILTWSSAGFGNPDAYIAKFVRRLPWYAVHIMMVVPFAFYNGKVGYRSKPFNMLYSIFYPAHLAIFALIRACLGA